MKRLFLSICPLVIAAFLLVALGLVLHAEAASSARADWPPLFTDDFESGTDKWVPQGNTCTSVITDGTNHVYSVTNCGGSTARTFISDTGSFEWTDYSIQARIYVTGTGNDYAMLLARTTDDDNYYFMTLRLGGSVQIRQYYEGSSSGRTLNSASDIISPATWYTATFEVDGDDLRAYIDDTLVVTATHAHTEAFSMGTAGVAVDRVTALVDDVIVSEILATLSVTKDGTGDGTVTSVPAGIDCGMTCTADFAQGTVVTLTAVPTTGSTFVGWGGACMTSGTVVPPTLLFPYSRCVISATGTLNATATFDVILYDIFLPLVLRNAPSGSLRY